jgi:predicted RNase H-like HicB family nuclease
MKIEIERESDGRWIAEIPDLPGVMSYGQTREEAVAKAKALALRVLADRLEHDEDVHSCRSNCPHPPIPRLLDPSCLDPPSA